VSEQPTRDPLGRPESPADTRFFDLRGSGYAGPIDQDGYSDTTSDTAAILRELATRRGEEVTW
jgi:hypothetical protein